MKVVLFCGGRGLRLREHSEVIPKPMVRIGYRPILWHVMRYYAHFGHGRDVERLKGLARTGVPPWAPWQVDPSLETV